jgi:signal transduction histidine kinase
MRDIVARIDSLNDLLNDLMVFARPRTPRREPLDLRNVVADAIAQVRRDPAAEQVVITAEGETVPVDADGEMLGAALLNLLLNASQAMDGRGTITVAVAGAADEATIEVRDSGPGIPPQIRSRVFDPFFTTKARGGGLGLAIARRGIELHGGALMLDCPAAGGTVATIRLPMGARVNNHPC